MESSRAHVRIFLVPIVMGEGIGLHSKVSSLGDGTQLTSPLGIMGS